MRHRLTLVVLASFLFLSAADEDTPKPPKSPKATDALRIDAAAMRKASLAYWQACYTADQRLKNELNSAADAAHARNDGVEEQACLDAIKDVQARCDTEGMSASSALPVAPLPALRCEEKDKDKKDPKK